jgi:hypothetical protein
LFQIIGSFATIRSLVDRDGGRKLVEVKSSFAILALLLLCAGVVACGNSGAEKHAASVAPTAVVGTTTTATTAPKSAAGAAPSLRSLEGDEDDDETDEHLSDTSKDNDADFDNDLKPQPGYDDSDDGPVRDYGRAASPAQEKLLKGVVLRYFAAAASGDGATGCSLIDANFVKAIPEDYGQAPGPTYSRGKTCPVVLSATFKHAHAELSGSVLVTAVRIQGNRALVLVGSTTMPAGYVELKHARGRWGIVGLLGTPMP